MTSRTSFSRLIKPTLKKSYAWFIIAGIYVLVNAISDLLNAQSYIANLGSGCPQITNLSENLANLCSPYECGSQLFLAFALGACMAMHYFSQFYAKKQADFYGAFPISRKNYWFLSAACSMVIFAVFSTIAVIIRTCIVVAYGASVGIAIKMSIATLISSAFAFMLSWLTMNLAAVLTGNLVVACMGYVMFCIYVPLMIGQIISAYASAFYKTFVEMNLQVFDYTSPASIILLMRDCNDSGYWTYSGKPIVFAVAIVMVLALSILNIKLYEHRALEKTGTAMAFKHSMPIIKIFISVPIALLFGILFIDLNVISYPWLYTGIVLGAFLANGIIESIYRFDIRGMISSWKHLVIIIVIAVAASLVFITDITGFDTKIPSVDEVKSIAITGDSTEETQEIDNQYKGDQSTELKESMLEYVNYLVENNSADTDNSDSTIDSNLKTVNVSYKLNNGKKMLRTYAVDNNDAHREAFAKMYDNKEFKQFYYALYAVSDDAITGVQYYDYINSTTVSLNKSKLAEFAKIYKSELNALDYKTMLTQPAVGLLTVDVILNSDSPDGEIYNTYTVPVYSSFTKTLSYMKKGGIKTGSISENYKIKEWRITNIGDIDITAMTNDTSYGETTSITDYISSIDPQAAFDEGKTVSKAKLESVLNLKTDVAPTDSCARMNVNDINTEYVLVAKLEGAQLDYVMFYILDNEAVAKLTAK